MCVRERDREKAPINDVDEDSIPRFAVNRRSCMVSVHHQLDHIRVSRPTLNQTVQQPLYSPGDDECPPSTAKRMNTRQLRYKCKFSDYKRKAC